MRFYRYRNLKQGDILVRIRNFGSMPVTNGYLSFSAYYFLKIHLHYKKKAMKKSQNRRNQSKFFLLYLLDDRRIWIHNSDIQQLTDPDPQH